MRKTKRILSVILSIAMLLSAFSFVMPMTASAAAVATGISNSYDGSKAFSLDKAAANGIITTANHGGIGGKAEDDVAGYVEVTGNSSLGYGGDSFASSPWYPAVADINNNRSLMAMDVMFTSPDAILAFEYQAIAKADATAQTSYSAPVCIGPAIGVQGKNSTVIDENAPTSLSVNEWHNIAVEVACDGTSAVYVYIDGVKYTCALSGPSFGTYRFRMNVVFGSFYIDNYYCYNDVQEQDMYAEESYVMTDIEVTDSEKVTYDADAKQFTLLDSTLTVSELKELIVSDYEVTVYSDPTYAEALAENDAVSMTSIVVTSNGDKSYRYYDFVRTNDTIFEYNPVGDGISAMVTGYKADSIPEAGSALVIPETVAGYTVTDIGANAFRVGTNYSGVKLSSITMPDTVKNIGSGAFYDTYAAMAAWPADLETIGASAFVHGGDISGKFPEGLKSVGNNAFDFSGIVKSEDNGVLYLPEGLETLGTNAFLWCGDIKTVKIPDTVTSIGNGAFQTSSGINTLRFPRNEAVTEIPNVLTTSYPNRNDRLFVDMSIYIPETITTIPDSLVKHFKDGANVTIYGVYGSAAYDFYLMVKEGLENGTYTNAAVYPETGSGYTNPEDADGDGKGELASISFAEYDFVNDTDFSSADINKGDTALKINTVTNDSVITENIAGVGGKTADDVVLKLDTMGGTGGQNYFGAGSAEGAKSGVFYHEISVRAPEVGAVGVQFGTYNTEDMTDDPDGDGVKDGYYNTNPSAFWVSANSISVMGSKVMDAVAGRWYTIATEIACDGTDVAAVYINGEKFEAELDQPAYGVRHFRVYPASNSTVYQIYYDNFRAYRSTSKNYNQKGDVPATVTSNSDAIAVYYEGIVYADPEAVYTAGELKAMLETDEFSRANVRIYSDATYTTELADEDNVTNSSVVVVAATNGFDIERVYSYYPINPLINTTIYAISVIDEEAKTARVTGFNERNITETDDLSGVTIPEEIMGYTVTEIGANAFYGNTEIQTVSIPDTVTKIGDRAFGNTSANGVSHGAITSVKLSANVKEIGANAFSCNSGLKYIELPDGLEKIGSGAFYWTGLKELTIPDSVTSIGTNAFRLTSIGYLKLSSGVTSYTSAQFSGANTRITEIVIPATVTNIGVNVFRDQSKDADGNVIADSDNTANMGDVVVYGVAGTYAEEYATKYGFEFVNIIANTIVASSGIYGDGSKELAGTDFDIKYGYENLTFKGKLINIGAEDTVLNITLELSDSNGNVLASTSKDIAVAAGATVDVDENSGIKIDVDTLANGYTARATIKSGGTEVAEPVEFVFNTDKREIHVLHIANSFGNDSFGYLNAIAKADGIIIKNQNMYIGGAEITQHYKNMLGDLPKYQAVINTVYSGEDNLSSVKQALESDKWDVVALQGATHGFSSDYAFIDYATWSDDAKGSETGTPNITTEEIYTYIEDYVETYAPNATKIMHMSWGPCEAQSLVMYGNRFADEEDARGAMFNAQKAAYEYASTIYADEPNMMVPSSYAVQYALNVLGYQEHSGEVNGEKYDSPVAGEISIYRDETCHLTTGSSPYGRVLAGLTWYEYLTGNDVRENTYQHSGISADVMAGLKEAAHWANQQVVPVTGSVPQEDVPEAEIKVNVIGGSAKVKVNGTDKGDAASTASYPMGTVLTYTAVAEDENKTFLYWQDTANKTMLSETETLVVTVGSDSEYVAVFADKTEEIYVTFKSNNKILAAGLKGSIEIPSNPYITGYNFVGWYVNDVKTEPTVDVAENTVYVAGFTADATEYDITVTGAAEQGGKYMYNEKVTVTAAGEEGKVFTHWTRNDQVVSYSQTYSFYVNGAAEIAAHYADAAAEEQIVLVMATPTIVGDNSDKIAFYAERNVPASYKVIETGILVSQADSFDLTTSGVIKVKATSTANIGQYTVRKANVASGDTWNAKAYLIYSDGTNVYTVYSDMVTKTL